jgi:hypothetical protein
LHLRRLEELVEQVGDAHREQSRDVTCAANVEPAQPPCETRLFEEVARAT